MMQESNFNTVTEQFKNLVTLRKVTKENFEGALEGMLSSLSKLTFEELAERRTVNEKWTTFFRRKNYNTYLTLPLVVTKETFEAIQKGLQENNEYKLYRHDMNKAKVFATLDFDKDYVDYTYNLGKVRSVHFSDENTEKGEVLALFVFDLGFDISRLNYFGDILTKTNSRTFTHDYINLELFEAKGRFVFRVKRVCNDATIWYDIIPKVLYKHSHDFTEERTTYRTLLNTDAEGLVGKPVTYFYDQIGTVTKTEKVMGNWFVYFEADLDLEPLGTHLPFECFVKQNNEGEKLGLVLGDFFL